MSDQPTCGHCGVYRHLHPTPTCATSRYSFWWDRHYLWRHIAGGNWGCLCDVPLPTDASEPRPEGCYCTPAATPTGD